MNDECRDITVGELTKEIGALIGVPMEATDRVDPLSVSYTHLTLPTN